MSLTKVKHQMIHGAPANVLDYGAVVGVNTLAVQSANVTAFHDAMAANKRVYVPAGNYYTNATIEIQQTGQKLYGDGHASGGSNILIQVGNTNTMQSNAQSDVEICGIWIGVKGAIGVGYRHYGGAWLHLHDCTFYPTDGSEGIGVILDDRNSSGTFVNGSYIHRLDFLNMSRGTQFLDIGIQTAGTSGGINATNVTNCHIKSDECIQWNYGGGGSISDNLLQSATGSYATPVGFGFNNTGGNHSFNGNYMEGFLYDIKHDNTSVGSSPTVSSHHTDGTGSLIGYQSTATDHSPFLVSAAGVEATVMREGSISVLSSNSSISLTGLSHKISGNGAIMTGCTLSTDVSRGGQLCYVSGSSWAVQIIESTTADFGTYASNDGIIIGQAGATVAISGVTRPVFRSALFYFNAGTSKWDLLHATAHRSTGGGNYERGEITANSQVIETDARSVTLSGSGAHRTGCTLEAPVVDGQKLTLFNISWSVGIVPGSTARFAGNASSVTIGGSAGYLQAMEMTAYSGKWYETSRTLY